MSTTTLTRGELSFGLASSSVALSDMAGPSTAHVDRGGIDDSAFLSAASSFGRVHDTMKAPFDAMEAPSLWLMGAKRAHLPSVTIDTRLWASLFEFIGRLRYASFDTSVDLAANEQAAVLIRLFRWAKPDRSFRLGALTLGVVDVERRVFGTAGDDSNAGLAWQRRFFGRRYPAVPHLVLEALIAGAADPAVLDSQFIVDGRWTPEALRLIEQAMVECGSTSGPVGAIIRSAVLKSLVRTRDRLRSWIAICGVVPIARRRRCWPDIDTARTAVPIHRAYVLRRCAAIGPPGRIVTASTRICRGPNPADGSVIPNRLRGCHIRP